MCIEIDLADLDALFIDGSQSAAPVTNVDLLRFGVPTNVVRVVPQLDTGD